MKVKIFDENHEKDLENSVNMFLSTLNSDIIDIKYRFRYLAKNRFIVFQQ